MTTLILTIGGVGALFVLGGILVEAMGDPGALIITVGMGFLAVAVLILAVIGGICLWA